MKLDGLVFGVGIAVDQLPPHVRRGGQLVDVAHVVLPFDPYLGGRVLATAVGVRLAN